MRQLLPSDLLTAEYARTVHVINVPQGTTIENMLEPDYWAHVAQGMRIGDRIEAHAQNWTWCADFVVTQIDTEKKVWAKVKLLNRYQLVKDDAILPEVDAAGKYLEDKEFEIKFRDKLGWSVIRRKDQIIVFENGKGRDNAVHWIDIYRRKVAA